MIISAVRAYIKSQIAKIDPDLQENSSAFYDGDIGETKLENTYQISFGALQNTARAEHRENSVPVVVSLFGHGYREEIALFDKLYDKAICIMDEVIGIENFAGVDYIVKADASTIDPRQLETNDNSFRFDINFTVYVAYSREG
jgi:hypothetical protein